MKKASPFIYLWWLVGSSLLQPLLLLCCFPWCVSLVVLFQFSLKSCLFEEGVGFVPQKGSCRDAQRAAPQMPEPVHTGCTVSKESSLRQPTLHEGEHSISNLQYGKSWEYLPINSFLLPALVSGMTMPAMTMTAYSEGFWSNFFYSERNSTLNGQAFMFSIYGAQAGVSEYMAGMGLGARMWLSSLQHLGSLQVMLPLAAVQALPLLCQAQPVAGHPRGLSGCRMLSQGWGMTGSGRGDNTASFQWDVRAKLKGNLPQRAEVPSTQASPHPQEIFLLLFFAHVYTCPSPISVKYCLWYLIKVGHVKSCTSNDSNRLGFKTHTWEITAQYTVLPQTSYNCVYRGAIRSFTASELQTNLEKATRLEHLPLLGGDTR